MMMVPEALPETGQGAQRNRCERMAYENREKRLAVYASQSDVLPTRS